MDTPWPVIMVLQEGGRCHEGKHRRPLDVGDQCQWVHGNGCSRVARLNPGYAWAAPRSFKISVAWSHSIDIDKMLKTLPVVESAIKVENLCSGSMGCLDYFSSVG